jgi:hypothetical protein
MKTTLISSFLLIVFFMGCKKDSTTQQDASQANDRKKALDDYNSNYLGSDLKYSLWDGNINDCVSGLCPQTTNNAVLKRINYFRRLVGLNDNIVWNTSLFPKYQKTALMMKANNQIEHLPPNTWDCWSQEGSDGAATSNLSLGSHSVDAVTGQVRDNGSTNADVGHRRWILYSRQSMMSYGSTDNTMSLGVFGIANGHKNTQYPEFIAYPPNGYIPFPLLFTRWSCSVPNANMKGAAVVMTGPQGNVPVKIIANGDEYGDPTVVWEPQGLAVPVTGDFDYTITVSNIVNAPKTSYTYTVKVFRP